MGDVVDFTARRAGLEPRRREPRGPAEIHLFLGVRYERDTDEPAARRPDRTDTVSRQSRPRRRRRQG